MKSNVYVDYQGIHTDTKNAVDTVKELWKEQGNKVKDLVSVDVYIKPEENKCYYVLNGEITGSFDL